jgi:predicted DNA binding CopG/RHH family protein
MREPQFNHLKIDEDSTAQLRAALAGKKPVKITIQVDTKSLRALKQISRQTGMPYQALVGQAFKETAHRRASTESRLDRLEQEVKKMKRILVA